MAIVQLAARNNGNGRILDPFATCRRIDHANLLSHSQ
jgi:hypothetical protein